MQSDETVPNNQNTAQTPAGVPLGSEAAAPGGVPSVPFSTPEPTPTPEPMQGPAPLSPSPAPQPPKKSKKGVLIGAIAAGLLVVGLVSAGTAYAFVYNTPQNAVTDSLSKLVAAKSGTATMDMSVQSGTTNLTASATYMFNDANQSAVDLKVQSGASSEGYTVAAHAVLDGDQYYVKVDDVRSLLTSLLGDSNSAAIQAYYGSLLDKVDTKWVGVSQKDLESLSGESVKSTESTCVQNEFAKLKTNASLRNELFTVYNNNPLFTITTNGNDADGNRYILTPVSNTEAKKFFTAVVDTTFFKAVDDCVSTDMRASFTNSFVDDELTSTTAKPKLELWVDPWSHNLNKAKLTTTEDTQSATVELKFALNATPSITIPKAQTTYSELKSMMGNVGEELLGV